MSEYCAYVLDHPTHKSYHDYEYGFLKTDETALFELLVLEINQAGLSWDLMLKKRATMRAAYDGFDVDKIAAYGSEDTARLLEDSGIIRNRLKVAAAIHNAKVVQSMRGSHGGFTGWLAAHHPLVRKDWTKLFKKTFKFTGGEIVNEFLMSTGYLPFAHGENCPIGQKITDVPWQRVGMEFYKSEM